MKSDSSAKQPFVSLDDDGQIHDSDGIKAAQDELLNIYESPRKLWNTDKGTGFDERTIYNKELKPLVRKIHRICQARGIPFYFTACIANTEEEGQVYVSDTINPEANNIILPGNHFAKHVNVDLGFDTVLPHSAFMKASEGEVVQGVPVKKSKKTETILPDLTDQSVGEP